MNFSRRIEALPAPPWPAITSIRASSINFLNKKAHNKRTKSFLSYMTPKSILALVKWSNTKKKNKVGNPLPRQAHMELIIKESVKVNLGDTIYYVNTGTKKSHADVKSKKLKEGGISIEFNSSLIPTHQIENNPNLKGDYNVSKYLTAFNTRIEPLIVCFNPEIRNDILIDNPTNRKYFTEKQLELCSGYPTDPKDQDTLDDVFVMEQKEVDFWNKVGVDPEYMYVNEDDEIEDIKNDDVNDKNEIEYF
jgi:hypothetical protein